MLAALKAYAALMKMALVGVACLFVLIFYEGIPWILDGRVDRVRKDALEGYVSQVELDAARAKNAELLRQLAAGRKAADGFAELLAAAQEKIAADAAADKQKEAEYEAQLAAAGRSCGLDGDDIRWLRE